MQTIAQYITEGAYPVAWKMDAIAGYVLIRFPLPFIAFQHTR